MDIEELEKVLSRTGNSAAKLDHKLALIEHERDARAPSARREVDRMLLEMNQAAQAKAATQKTRLHEQVAENLRLRTLIGELKEHVEKLVEPPWHTGTFVRLHETPRGLLAEVVHGGGRQLIGCGDDVDPQSLSAGAEVYLNAERTVIVRAPAGGGAGIGEVATVERPLPDRRLLIRVRDAQMVISAAETLGPVKAGNAVRWLPHAALAVEPIPAAEGLRMTPQIAAGVPAQLVGIDVGDLIDRVTGWAASPAAAQRYRLNGNRSVLMHGPAGCGKTLIMRSIAHALSERTGRQCRVDIVNGSELESPYVGETQQNIKRRFREANEHDGPAIIFLDEVEAVGRIRGGASAHFADKFLVTLMTELDGIEPRSQVVVIAATNRKDLLDPAFLERLSALELHVPRPKQAAAREMLEVHLPEDLPYRPNGAQAPDTRQSLVEYAVARLFYPNGRNDVARLRFRDGTTRLVAARELISGRLIEQICVAAREQAFLREVRNGPPGLCAADMEVAVAGALARLRSELSIHNVRSHLEDLPADADVIAVESIRAHADEPGAAAEVVAA